ncbi:TPA: RecE family exodeoxyribonuclease [Citrobacter freundii]
MSGTNPVFLVRRAKKQSGNKDAVLWCSDDFEAVNATLDYLLIKTGAKLKNYFKAVATNFPVVNELPPEGELSLTFCDFYRLRDDNMTWEQIPGVTLPSSDAAAEARQHIVNGVDTSTGEIVDQSQLDQSDNNGLDVDEYDDEYTRYPIVQMPFRKQLLSQFTSDALRHHLTLTEHKEIVGLEMDTDNGYVQNLILAAESVEGIKKLDMPFLWQYTKAMKDVFDPEKRHELSLMLHFSKAWIETTHIDRGTLVKEWIAGNRISKVLPPNTPEKAPEKKEKLTTVTAERYKRAVAQSIYNLNVESCIARIYPDAEPGSITVEQLKSAKELIDSRDDIQAKVIKVISQINDIMDYDALSIFGVTRAIDWSDCLNIGPVILRDQARKWLAENGIYSNGKKSNGYREWEEDPRSARHSDSPSTEEVGKQLAAQRGEFVEGISDPDDPKWVKTETSQQSAETELVKNVGNGIFDVTALLQNSATHGTTKATESTSNVQVQETVSDEKKAGTEVQSGESSLETGEKSYTSQQADVNQNTNSVTQNSDSVNQTDPVLAQTEPEAQSDEPAVAYPTYFEPGRYEGLPNEVYHAANGISSTQVKDARVSLMYFNARHVEKTIIKERSPVLDMGNLVHVLALQPEQIDEEFSVEPLIPDGAFTTTATIRSFIDEYNASLPAQLSADDIKVLLEEHNAAVPQQVPLGASLEETGQNYMALPAEYQRIQDGQKQTAAAMKACIKEYNATLPAQVKTSGSRDVLLEQLAIINPDLVAQEAQKLTPLKVSGTKADLIQAVKSVNPNAVFADELLEAWRENPQGKVLVTRQQLSTALNIQKVLLQHPTAGKLLTHPSRAVEVSYFGFDDETGLEVRVRPDLEIDLDGVRIGADLKTISMWNIKQEGLRAKLHREIIDRDYHLSAAMYCETAALDQFFWIFVNKDENYHWIVIIEASAELLELGMLEYRKAMRAIATGFDTGEWPAPITTDYTDELNDFDLRRLEALRTQA